MTSKYFGVVEGFYGKPYTFKQRLDLISLLSDYGLNIYVYGPKTDLYHRKQWHKPYPVRKLREFEKLIEHSRKHSICFNYAISPMTHPDTSRIIQKISLMMKTGIEHFSLFYDDIKVSLTKKTAREQLMTANELFTYLNEHVVAPSLFFCPTQYRGFEISEYITTLSSELNPEIEIFWTGRHVVSRRISKTDVHRITDILKRPPLIWDNIFANDYIPGTIIRVPYRFRDPAIIGLVRGIVVNPMNQYRQSKPLIYTAAQFFTKPFRYKPYTAWKKAMDHLTAT